MYYAGFTHRGAIHDKTTTEQEIPDLECFKAFERWFSKDKVYQSFQPRGVHLLEPYKTRRNHPLKKWQK